MSHTILTKAPDFLQFVKLTIVDYIVGGELVTPSEIMFGATSVDGVFFAMVPAANNSLGVPLFPVIINGKVVLERFIAGVPTEISATIGLNAVIPALVKIGG